MSSPVSFQSAILNLAFQVQGGNSTLSVVSNSKLFDFSFDSKANRLTYVPPPGGKNPSVSSQFLFTKRNRLFAVVGMQEETFLMRDDVNATPSRKPINQYPTLVGRTTQLFVHDPYHSRYDWSIYALFKRVTSNALELYHLYQGLAGGAFNAQDVTLQSMPGDTVVVAARPGLDGKHMAFGTEKGTVHIFQSLQGVHVAKNRAGGDFVATDAISAMAFRPESKVGGEAQLAVADRSGNIWLFKSVKDGADTTYQEIGRFIVARVPASEKSEVLSLKYSPDGAFLVASWMSGLVVLFSVNSPAVSDSSKQVSFAFNTKEDNYAPPIAYHPHLHTFIVGSAKGKLYAVSCGTK
jgi:WD40 repeat protein